MAKKIITVFGATGAQGGGLVKAILEDPDSEFAVRAVTRDSQSEKAKALVSLGAEVVSADADDEASVERALEGAYGAFFVTFFWEHLSPDKETKTIQNYAEAAKKAGIQHAIWSTLEDTRVLVPLSDNRMPTLQEKYKVPHFDAKGEGDKFFKDLGIPTTFLVTSFYWDNFIHFGMGPKQMEDGSLAIVMPMGDKKLPGIAAEDIGRVAYGIFQKGPQEMAGKTIGIMGEALTGSEMAAQLSNALGKEIKYVDIEPDAYRAFGFPGADDIGNMFQYKRDFNDRFLSARSVERSRELNPKLKSFATWLREKSDQIPSG